MSSTSISTLFQYLSPGPDEYTIKLLLPPQATLLRAEVDGSSYTRHIEKVEGSRYIIFKALSAKTKQVKVHYH